MYFLRGARRLLTIMPVNAILCICLTTLFGISSWAQSAAPLQKDTQQSGSRQSQPGQLPYSEQPGVLAPGKTAEGQDKRVFGVLPNYRTAEMSAATEPLTSHQKFSIAFKDTFDYPLIGVSAVLAGLYQWNDSHPEFGQGMKGYLSRWGTSYCDQLTGNFLTEGLMPVVFREDPRYFRMAKGAKSRRLVYALTRIVITRTDSGHASFNYAEVLGNGMAAGIGLSYYPDSRDFPDYLQNWGAQLLTDATSQVLKEFWPDIKRKLYGMRHKQEATTGH
jgi:hypothetical protein